MDNMLWGNQKAKYNSEKFKQFTDGKELYETTLLYTKMVPIQNNPSDTFWTYFNQTFEANGKKYENDKIEGNELVYNLSDRQSLKSVSGSGGDYLSNEIFYRVAKLRQEQRPNLTTGHLHILLTQTTQDNKFFYIEYEYRNADKLTTDINPVIKDVITNINNLIIKI
ncbi:hypothetical protein IUY40_13485 [Flavobacterium sp. ALJ2]|uniref:hypothetical protein n=1 Tax=Flavobacterium sp. ALJ2 TaxID=2786960 RepID=UPI00189D217C|nr:hypothetical protein [Flavobacterium sp. ALJ2]MBF7092544.1 hypothetical protein [Flavobacterium sp. ALJ2]